MPVPIKVSTVFLIRLMLIATMRHRLINPSYLCPFSVVCTMTTGGLLEGECLRQKPYVTVLQIALSTADSGIRRLLWKEIVEV
jgi:hypothetical protein